MERNTLAFVYSCESERRLNDCGSKFPSNMYWGANELREYFDVIELSPSIKYKSRRVWHQALTYIILGIKNIASIGKTSYVYTYHSTAALVFGVLISVLNLNTELIVKYVDIGNLDQSPKSLKRRLKNLKKKLIFILSDEVIFYTKKEVSKNESIALDNDKLNFVQKGIDTKYYYESVKANRVIAVGNNKHRDWQTYVDAARKIGDMSFYIASHTYRPDENISKNITLKSDWSLLKTRNFLSETRYLVVSTLDNIHFSGSTTVLMGMSCGCIVFFDDRSVEQEYGFVDKKNIVYFQRGNTSDLIDKINSVRQNDKLKKKISKNAIEKAENLSMKNHVEELCEKVLEC